MEVNVYNTLSIRRIDTISGTCSVSKNHYKSIPTSARNLDKPNGYSNGLPHCPYNPRMIVSTAPLSVSSAHCHPSDKSALLAFKSSLNNPSYLSDWTPSTGCCDWYGITCDLNTTRVIGIELFRNELSGTIPSAVGDLPFLTSLDLRKLPNLTGNIPSAISRLTRLTFLRLDWNSLTGPVPAFLARLPALDYINLSFNRLSGSIPASLSTLPVTYLRLDRNRLTGSIPAALASSAITTLYLSHNSLTGPLPAAFGNTKLQDLDLSLNQLTGDASLLFGANKALGSLDLSGNMFEFDLTKVVFPEKMHVLDLNHNEIYGSIPKLDGLGGLNVSYNRLCGEIPSGGGRFQQDSFFHNRCLCGSPLPACT